MEFKLLYGRSGSGKTSYIFNDIKEKIDGESKIYIIVPEQFSFSAENHLLESIDQKSSINAEVLTLSRMADRVISDVIGNSTTHLSKVGKTMIVYDCLEKLRNNLNFLRSSDKNIDVASRMITEFKKHNVKSSDLATILEKLRNKYLELKLTDSKNILDRYQDRIEGNFLDEADKLDLLAQNIELVDYFNNAIIYIDEFAGFTPNEFQIIEKLCTLAKEITITICTDSLEKVDNASESIYYFNQITAEKLIETAKRTGAFIEKIDMGESKKFKNSELRVLERNIYSLNQDKILEETQDINLFIAKNPTSEIEHVAKCILRLVKQRKYRYKDIAVVAANVSNYSDDVKNIFKKYNIPVFIDEKKDITNNILMKYIISLFNIFSSNFSYESMFSYIKSGILQLNEDDVFLLENYVNKWGIRGSKWYKGDFTFEEKNDIQERINDCRKAIIAPIMTFRDNLIGEKSAKNICKTLYEFIEINGIQETILSKAKKLEENGNIEIADEYRAGIDLFFNVLDEIVLIFGDEKMSFDRFNKILQIGISESEFGRIPASFDQVLFGDIDRSRNREIKVLFLIGLNDGEIPRSVKDEGFLNDSDRDILKENNIEIAKNSVEMLYENQFNIYRTLSMPEEKLFLSYPVADKESNALRSSILVSQIKKIFPKLSEFSDVVDEEHEITTVEGTLESVVEEYRKYIDNEPIDQEWKNLIKWYKKYDSNQINSIFSGADFSNIPGHMSEENIKKMYGKSLRTSVSRLEQYRKCPFSFHLKYGLKLKEEDEFKIRTLDTGNFMHEVIDAVFTMIEDKDFDVKTITKDELYSIISRIINQKLQMSKNYIFTILMMIL